MKKIITSAFIIACSANLPAQNCSAPSSGFIPINDLGTGTFNTWTGGLYQNGSNYLPAVHKNAGLQMASQVQCLDSNGNADPVNGKIAWLSIGMSNCTQETQQFIPLANGFPGKNPRVTLIDGAQGGQTASIISTPGTAAYSNFWNTVNIRLLNAGVTVNQVQVIWFKEANIASIPMVQTYYDSLVVQFKRIMNELKARFPNSKLCYLSSRISGRYATTTLNPEPYAYWQGWAVKKVIDDQVSGDPQLQFSGTGANAPWMSWGIYMWADGSTPQVTNPNVFWNCPTDFNPDGTHPSVTGAQKVGNLLLDFFSSDSTTTPWFLGNGCSLTAMNESSSLPGGILIYPNPAEDALTVTGNFSGERVEIILYDIRSREVLKSKINNRQSLINVASLSDGIYFYEIKENFQVAGKGKIVIRTGN